jgi:hypothetical protein
VLTSVSCQRSKKSVLVALISISNEKNSFTLLLKNLLFYTHPYTWYGMCQKESATHMRTNFFPLNKFIYADIVRTVHQKQNNTQNYVSPKHPRNIMTQSPLQGPWWDVIWKSNVFLVELKWRWRFFFSPPSLCRNKGLCKASPILVIHLAESVVHDVKIWCIVFFLNHNTRPVSARCHHNKIKQKKCDTQLWCLKCPLFTPSQCAEVFLMWCTHTGNHLLQELSQFWLQVRK